MTDGVLLRKYINKQFVSFIKGFSIFFQLDHCICIAQIFYESCLVAFLKIYTLGFLFPFLHVAKSLYYLKIDEEYPAVGEL